jgi:glycosyltransferase involved in cell wall biosynthesis
MGTPRISVVIPAFDEEAGVAETVVSIRDALDSRGDDYEVLVVDNASTDRTLERVEPLADGKRVRVLRNDSNRGKGYSVRRGMLEARGELRLHCDADCADSMRSLPRMLELIESGADVVAGSRLAPGAEVVRQPLRRRIVGRAFVQLCRLLLREPTHDLYCGFKLWRAEAAVAAYGRQRQEGWVFDAEVLATARVLGYRVVETAVVWINREGSRLSVRRLALTAVPDLLAARRSVRRAERAAGEARARDESRESPDAVVAADPRP